MSLFSPEGGRDTIYFERNGNRTGPFKCNFTGEDLHLFYNELEVEEGDKLVREVPGKEQYYTIHEVEFQNKFGRIPAHYALKLSKDSAIPKPSAATTNHINIHGSTGIQIGNHNVQNLEIAMKEIVSAIDKSGASDQEKEDAKGLMKAFLNHPLVSAAVGAVPGVIALL